MIDRLLITKDEYEKIKSKGKIFDSRVTLKNKIDRLSLSTALSGEIYYEEEVYLNPEVFNLYFFIMTKDIEFFAPVFHWLSDTGIGGERTIGRGHYKIENEGEYPIPGAKNGASFITLSRYLPKNDEVNWKGINYYEFLPYHSRFDTMFLKGGEFLKRKFIYLKEGAILSFRKKREYYGMLYQVAEFQGKTIYQNGLTIPVFAKVGRRCK
jgi:CRISPR-associated protein Csm4